MTATDTVPSSSRRSVTGRRRARPLALGSIAVLVVGALALAACTTSSKPASKTALTTTTTAAAGGPATTTTLEPESGAGQLRYVYGPTVGDCIDLRSMATGRAVTTRATPAQDATQKTEKDVIVRFGCDLPHQYEVMAVLDAGLPRDPTPSPDQLAAVAKKKCASTFAPYVGIGYPESSLEIGWILPSLEQQSRGVQTFGCLAYDPKGKITGAVRNSKR